MLSTCIMGHAPPHKDLESKRATTLAATTKPPTIRAPAPLTFLRLLTLPSLWWSSPNTFNKLPNIEGPWRFPARSNPKSEKLFVCKSGPSYEWFARDAHTYFRRPSMNVIFSQHVLFARSATSPLSSSSPLSTICIVTPSCGMPPSHGSKRRWCLRSLSKPSLSSIASLTQTKTKFQHLNKKFHWKASSSSSPGTERHHFHQIQHLQHHRASKTIGRWFSECLRWCMYVNRSLIRRTDCTYTQDTHNRRQKVSSVEIFYHLAKLKYSTRHHFQTHLRHYLQNKWQRTLLFAM